MSEQYTEVVMDSHTLGDGTEVFEAFDACNEQAWIQSDLAVELNN